jgi:capsular polysaccharide biosynthesis protein
MRASKGEIMTGSVRFVGYEGLQKEERYAQTVRTFDLPILARDALVTPIIWMADQKSGAVYDDTGKLIRHSERQYDHRADDYYNPSHLSAPSGARKLRGQALFGGILFRQFGHVLIETLSRLWVLTELNGRADAIVFQALGAADKQALKAPVIRFIFEALDLDIESCQVVKEPLICEELLVPASTLVVAGFAHPRFIDIYDRVVTATGIRPSGMRRVYLSRRKLAPHKRHATNETEIEALVSTRGFEIIHPEEVPFANQVGLMQGAEVIAGCDGWHSIWPCLHDRELRSLPSASARRL